MLFPITFSIPPEKIDPFPHPKTRIVSLLIPGDRSTYVYKTEPEYYQQYKESYFAITIKKAGWDCMRHYEILANGCIPYFVDIEQCPANTMALAPKELLVRAKRLYHQAFEHKTIENLTVEDVDLYLSLRSELLDYTREHLTTVCMAKYILSSMRAPHAKTILYLSGDTTPDYLRCLTLHGFKTTHGANCHDYPRISHLYKDTSIDYSQFYGNGFTYTNLLDSHLHNDELDNTILIDIQTNYYDMVIYGSYHRGMPFYEWISTIYEPHQIGLLCGEDTHQCHSDWFVSKGHFVFVREL